MLWDSQTDAALSIIKQGKGAADESAWEAIFSAAKRWKPQGFDHHVGLIRDQYEGKIAAQLKAAAMKRFPLTQHRMPETPLNWCRLYAQNAASVFDWPPNTFLERTLDQQKEELTSESPAPDSVRAIDYDDMCREGQINSVLAEAERRVSVGRSVFIYVYSDSVEARATGKKPKTKLSVFWGTDCWVIPHPAAPTVLESASAFIARVSAPDGVDGSSECFIMWHRTYEDDELGLPKNFSRWRAQRITVKTDERGEKRTQIEPIRWATKGGGVSDEYPLPTLPWVAWHDGIPDGSPFMSPLENLIPLFNSANTALMAEQYASDMSSATPLIRKTNAAQPTTIALGPGLMPAIALEDDIVPIAMSADFDGMRAVTRGLLGAMALTNRQRIEGYDVEAQGQPVSGVALKIKGEPQSKARLESVQRAIEVTEKVLSIMIEIHDFYRGTSMAAPGITARVRPADPPEYEDREVTTRRWLTLRDAGLVSDAQALVGAGVARTLEEAQAMLEAIQQQRDARAQERMDAISQQPESNQPDQPDAPDTPDLPAEDPPGQSGNTPGQGGQAGKPGG